MPARVGKHGCGRFAALACSVDREAAGPGSRGLPSCHAPVS
jgi:hypothetical protein